MNIQIMTICARNTISVVAFAGSTIKHTGRVIP